MDETDEIHEHNKTGSLKVRQLAFIEGKEAEMDILVVDVVAVQICG